MSIGNLLFHKNHWYGCKTSINFLYYREATRQILTVSVTTKNSINKTIEMAEYAVAYLRFSFGIFIRRSQTRETLWPCRHPWRTWESSMRAGKKDDGFTLAKTCKRLPFCGLNYENSWFKILQIVYPYFFIIKHDPVGGEGSNSIIRVAGKILQLCNLSKPVRKRRRRDGRVVNDF